MSKSTYVWPIHKEIKKLIHSKSKQRLDICQRNTPTMTQVINARVKMGDIKGKKGGDPNSKDKDNNATVTAGAHVGDIKTPEDSTAPSSGPNLGAYVSETTKQPSWSTQSVEDLLRAHSIDNILLNINNTTNSGANTTEYTITNKEHPDYYD